MVSGLLPFFLTRSAGSGRSAVPSENGPGQKTEHSFSSCWKKQRLRRKILSVLMMVSAPLIFDNDYGDYRLLFWFQHTLFCALRGPLGRVERRSLPERPDKKQNVRPAEDAGPWQRHRVAGPPVAMIALHAVEKDLVCDAALRIPPTSACKTVQQTKTRSLFFEFW